MKPRGSALAMLLVLLVACGGTAEEPAQGAGGTPAFSYDPLRSWPQVGFGPGRAFLNPNEGKIGTKAAASLAPAWVRVEKSTLSAPILAGRYVFATTSAGALAVVDASLGTPKATVELGSGPAGAPAYAAGHVFVSTRDKRLVAVDATALTIAWTAQHTGTLTAPVVSDDVVYVGSSSGYTYAYAAGGCGAPDCLPRWAGPTASPVRSAPAIAHDHVYAVTEDGGLRAYPARGCDEAACAPAWSRRIEGGGDVGPTASNDRVFVAGTKGGEPRVSAYDASGNRAWVAPAPGTVTNLATDGALVHGTTSRGEVFALDARTGDLAWKSPSLGKITGAPALVNHALFVGVMGVDAMPQVLVFADACPGAECGPVARIPTGKDTVGPTAAAICRGRVHVANGSRLLALQPR